MSPVTRKSLRREAHRPRMLDVINRMHCHAFVIRMARGDRTPLASMEGAKYNTFS